EQHMTTLDTLLGGHVPIALLTGSTPAVRRREILARLESGELGLVVGTHALIEPAVRFRALGIVVVDEQHRFGVRQREALEAKAATIEFERRRATEFRDQRVELIHGQMASRAKTEAMRAFAEGDADVLVATSVIEVGVDHPNATVMLIEAAERYGISQL